MLHLQGNETLGSTTTFLHWLPASYRSSNYGSSDDLQHLELQKFHQRVQR